MDHGLTTRRLVTEIGPTLLRIAVDGSAADQPLTGVSIYDPATAEEPEPGCLVLGIGVTAADLTDLRAAVHRAGARALAVKGPVPEGLAAGLVPVIEVNPRAAWMHVAGTVRERMLEHSRAELRPAGVHSDLFAVANTIATMLDAAITIEDSSSAVLAWSQGQRETDEARVETVLGRSVNRRWLDELQSRGVFTRLHSTSAPVFVDPVAPGMLPRAAIAVRAGAEVLGYVWAVVSEPLSDELARQLEQLAPVVALHLTNTVVESTWARQQRGELASAVLAGGPAAIDAAQQLRLGSGPLCVLAATTRSSDPERPRTVGHEASAAIGLRRFEDTLALHLAAVHPSAVTVRGSQTVYALIAWPRSTPRQALDSARQLARDFLARSAAGFGHVIAVGGPAESLAHVPRARVQADAAVRALRHHLAGTTVATLDEVALPVMLLHLADVSDSLGLPEASGPLRALAEHDGPDRVLGHTLAVYLDAGGVAEDAAVRLRVHVNTLRYRLRRIREISGLDFADADAVLLAHLQLRLGALRSTIVGVSDKDQPAFSS